ncbi:MAG: hypothetical protein K5761_02570 [Clostridiales bacterium]|nr:hypothetical protein [Clostridiales bacterium]
MSASKYRNYWLLFLAAVIAACAYPLYMGIHVILKMAQSGAVPLEEYPKYVIPYTPIALAVITGVLLIPLIQKVFSKLDLLFGSLISIAVFFVTERIMETKILVQTKELIPLESWQMSLCYMPPEQYETRTWEAVDVLLGGYSPAFKIHFYLISVVIIVSLLNSFYGFAKMVRSENKRRKKALIVQTITAVLFLCMCIWACFTAFYRSGELTVSPVSAVLMAIYFALLGVTMGVFTGSYTLEKSKLFSLTLPALTSALITCLMYAGEMILLNGNLYRFGRGLLFEGLGKLVLAPADILIIIASGLITFLICRLLNGCHRPEEKGNAD